MTCFQSNTESLVGRDFREARDASEEATDLLKMQNVDVLALLKDAYQVGFIAGLRRERTRYGDAPKPLEGEACGRWVGDQLWWDIHGETISDEKLRHWIADNLPDSGFRSTAGGIVAYHTRAYANRRQAISAFMRTLKW